MCFNASHTGLWREFINGKSNGTGTLDSPRCGVSGDERNGPGLRDWPPRMEIGEEMKRKVQERWREYGFVKSGAVRKVACPLNLPLFFPV